MKKSANVTTLLEFNKGIAKTLREKHGDRYIINHINEYNSIISERLNGLYYMEKILMELMDLKHYTKTHMQMKVELQTVTGKIQYIERQLEELREKNVTVKTYTDMEYIYKKDIVIETK